MTIKTLAFIRTLLTLLTISLVAYGCGNNEPSNNFPLQKLAQKYSEETTLKGKVSNKEGGITSGKITATDKKGKIVAKTQLENSNQYSVVIPTGTELPVVLSYYPEKSTSKKATLISAVIYTTITKYDINDLTTLIAKNAKALGGYNHSNMTIAADSTVGVPDANKTSTGFRGDPTRQYGGWH